MAANWRMSLAKSFSPTLKFIYLKVESYLYRSEPKKNLKDRKWQADTLLSKYCLILCHHDKLEVHADAKELATFGKSIDVFPQEWKSCFDNICEDQKSLADNKGNIGHFRWECRNVEVSVCSCVSLPFEEWNLRYRKLVKPSLPMFFFLLCPNTGKHSHMILIQAAPGDDIQEYRFSWIP